MQIMIERLDSQRHSRHRRVRKNALGGDNLETPIEFSTRARSLVVKSSDQS